ALQPGHEVFDEENENRQKGFLQTERHHQGACRERRKREFRRKRTDYSLVPTEYVDQATRDVTYPFEGTRYRLHSLAELEIEPFTVSPVPAEPRICRFAHRRQEGRCDRVLHRLESIANPLLGQHEARGLVR